MLHVNKMIMHNVPAVCALAALLVPANVLQLPSIVQKYVSHALLGI